jgi:hypothetical protein
VKAHKKKIDQLWWRANSARNEELAFIDHVENLSIPSEAGNECKVRAEREDYKYVTNGGKNIHKHDFLTFYLNGDCNGDEEVKVKFQKGANFWNKNIYYEGDKTDLSTETSTVKEFTLKADGTTDRIGFRVFKGARLVAKTPRGIVITDRDLQ